MLCVLKRTVSMRRFLWAPKTYVKTYGSGNIYNFTLKNFAYLNLWLLSILDFQANKFPDLLFNYELTRYMENSVDPDQLASSEVSWLGSTLFSIDCLSFFHAVFKEFIYGRRREKTCLRGFANNTGADQPAQSDQRLCYLLFGKYHI